MPNQKKEFRWKGKIVSEKLYKLRMKQVENGKKRKKLDFPTASNVEAKDSQYVVEGRRIVELQVMAQHMYCTSCNQLLALANIEKERKQGLASMYSIRCHHCLLINLVPSGKQHPGLSKQSKSLFDVNSKAALGKQMYF